MITVKASSTETGKPLATFETDYSDHLSVPEIVDASCKTNKKGELVCRIVLSTVSGALVQIQAGKIKWVREESLANIAAIEMIDLPLADAEGAIEKQLKSKSGKNFRPVTRLKWSTRCFESYSLHCKSHVKWWQAK